MQNILLKIAKYLDEKGKYKQADLLEENLKTAQFTNYFTGTSPRQNLTGRIDDVFNPFAQIGLTTGFNPALVKGPGASLKDMPRLYTMTPQQLQDLKNRVGPEVFAQMVEAEQVGIAERLGTLRAGRSIADLRNLITIVRQTLLSERIDPNTGQKIGYSDADKRRIFKDRFSETVSTSIQNMLMTEQSLDSCAQIIQDIGTAFTFPEMRESIVGAINSVVQATDPMFNKNQFANKRHQDIRNHPYLKQFVTT